MSDIVKDAPRAPVTAKSAKAAKSDAPAPPVPLENYEVIELHRSQLVDAPYNPRKLSPKARERLQKGIKKIGLLAPPVWNKRTGHIVSGHQRVTILDALKRTQDYTLKVAQVDLDEKREKEANILLNNAEAQGEWDLEKLDEMFKGDIDIDMTGFDVADVYRMFGDSPFAAQRQHDIDELAASLRQAQDRYKDVAGKSAGRDATDFYLVVVFKDEPDRKAFLDAGGLEDNKFQDGRLLRKLILRQRGEEQDDD